MKCKFTSKEMEERLIEQIIASTPLADYQKELLSKDKKYSLEDAIKLGRTYEASASHTTAGGYTINGPWHKNKKLPKL